MNPLQLIFFLSIFVDDFFFKERKLSYLFFFCIVVYGIANFFSKFSHFHTSYRKLQMAAYSPSEDPTLVSKLKLSSDKPKKFLEALSKKLDKKITWTLYTVKVLGEVLAEVPSILLALKFGKVLIKYKI